jgi:hypothetical protein
MPDALPHTLTSLTPREAIADALARCIHGIDTNDRDLFTSACLQTEDLSVTAGPSPSCTCPSPIPS